MTEHNTDTDTDTGTTYDDRDPDRNSAKRRYNDILEVVRKTADERPGISANELWQNRYHAGYDPRDVQSSVQAAVENNDLARFAIPGGDVRYFIATEDNVREAIAWLVERTENTDRIQPTVAHLNEQLDAITNGADS
jgi:hypothetical protein